MLASFLFAFQIAARRDFAVEKEGDGVPVVLEKQGRSLISNDQPLLQGEEEKTPVPPQGRGSNGGVEQSSRIDVSLLGTESAAI